MSVLWIEGWRASPHSYAMVNQYQCLELLRRQHLQVYHRDVPFFRPHWRSVHGIFSADEESTLRRIPAISPRSAADALYRIAYPIDLTPQPHAGRTVVFGTIEMPGMKIDLLAHGKVVDRFGCGPEVQLVTPSEWSREGYFRAGSDPARTHVVPHGVDPQTYRPMSPERRHWAREGLNLQGFTFLHVGAMTGNKGCDLLVRAFAHVCRRYPEATLLIKGMDALYSSKQLLGVAVGVLSVEELERVAPRIRYFGGVFSNAEMAFLYSAADAYVCPYRAEGFNLPALEAAACGLPILCTAGGPTDEFTTPQFARRIQAKRVSVKTAEAEHDELQPDIDHLIELMTGIIEDEQFRARAMIEGPKWVQSRFTWTHVIDQVLKIMSITVPPGPHRAGRP